MMLQVGPDRWLYKEVLSAWMILKCNPDLPNVLVLMNIPFHCPAEFCNRTEVQTSSTAGGDSATLVQATWA